MQFKSLAKMLRSWQHFSLTTRHAKLGATMSAQSLPDRPTFEDTNALSAKQWSTISEALAVVHQLQQVQHNDPALLAMVHSVKRAQCSRFQRSYFDVLTHSDWADAAQFFLQELYADRDFSRRDAAKLRIAPAIERLFPHSVVLVATTLAQLHALSEQLDHRMALAMLAIPIAAQSDPVVRAHYPLAWRAVGQRAARAEQLALVEHLGAELVKITRVKGLRVLLRMMRGPAHAAGLEHLQKFLEQGFDTFAAMQRSKAGVAGFLSTIRQREDAWLNRLFDTPATNPNFATLWPELE
jgi:hypothetical protein